MICVRFHDGENKNRRILFTKALLSTEITLITCGLNERKTNDGHVKSKYLEILLFDRFFFFTG